MTRWGAGALVALALGAGLALRVARLDVRPMHHDEANQAVKFGVLLDRGEYRYDAHDHHGPTLYYLTLPAAAIRGQKTFASLDERTLRGVTALFGAATILLLPLLAGAIGRTATTAAAWLLAVSPAMVFYSRMYIQESLFACFTLAFAVALGRLVSGGGLTWAAVAGLAAGLAAATKETSAIMLPAAIVSCAIAWWSVGPERRPRAGRLWRAALLVVAIALALAAVFYSSFLTNPGGVLAPFRAAGTYLDRGIDPAAHAHPWHYYLRLLAYSASGGLMWTEALVLVLALAGAVSAWRGGFWARYFVAYVAIATAIFSVIPYKTPWNLLPFYAGAFVLAGIGVSALVHATSSRVVRAALVVVLAAGMGHLGWQAWRAAVRYAADPRNPYVYAQTVPDAVRMAARIRDLAAVHPDRAGMVVSVIAPPDEQWPLPWYLRTMPHVGYWTTAADALGLKAPVVVASLDQAPAVDQALGERYVSEFFGLRPDVLQVLYIERNLWERFLAAAAREPSAARRRASVTNSGAG